VVGDQGLLERKGGGKEIILETTSAGAGNPNERVTALGPSYTNLFAV